MGSATPDISSVRALVARTRRRLRIQAALEGAATATVLASAAALLVVFGVRTYTLSPGAGLALLVASVGIIIAGAAIAATRPLEDEDVARRIDRASNLSDRLSTAVAFEHVLRTGAALPAVAAADAPDDATLTDDETRALMRAAIRDGVKHAPRADWRGAAPYAAPRDARPAGVFALVAVLAAGLGLPARDPRVIAADPARAARGAHVVITGEWLCGPTTGAATACASTGHRVVLDATVRGAAPGLAAGASAIALDASADAEIVAWTGASIEIVVPATAPIGEATLTVYDGRRRVGAVPFEVIDPIIEKRKSPDAVVWDPDDQSYTKDLLEQLREVAKRDQVPELEAFANKVEELIQKAEDGELTKEQLLEELKKAEEALMENGEPDPEQVKKDLQETGKELEKNELTKELGKALDKGDLEKAKEEMEKLAEKLDKGELDEKQQKELAKALEKAAEEYEKKQEQRDKQEQVEIEKAKKEVQRLEKDKEKEQDPKKKEDLERRLDKKKRELEKLEKKKDQKDKSEQRRALKRLHKKMKEAAEDLKKKDDPKDPDDQQQNQKQASEKMKDAAEETGKVDQDQRKQTTQKKVASQMDDLREAMRRAKRRGKQGPKNPFGKNGKQSDFDRRARGQKGQKGAWKPGKGQGQGQGDQNGGNGQGDPQQTDTWGTGHDPNLEGDPTAKSGDTEDADLQGTHGKGPSRRQTIVAAAQKGFASKSYKKVYADYKEIVEEVMRSEKVPSSYKYYIKKYFTKIKPHAMDD